MTRVLVGFVVVSACLGSIRLQADTTQDGGPYYRPNVVVQLNGSDLGKAIVWYEQVLGFKTTERRDDLKFAHVATNVPGLELGLGEGGTHKGTGTVIINFSVADVAAARQLLESRGNFDLSWWVIHQPGHGPRRSSGREVL